MRFKKSRLDFYYSIGFSILAILAILALACFTMTLPPANHPSHNTPTSTIALIPPFKNQKQLNTGTHMQYIRGESSPSLPHYQTTRAFGGRGILTQTRYS